MAAKEITEAIRERETFKYVVLPSSFHRGPFATPASTLVAQELV